MQANIKKTGPKNQITLPRDMSLDQAINALAAEKSLEFYGDQEVTVIETIERFPFEAAIAMQKAITQLHGTALHRDLNIGGQVIETKTIGIPISIDETVQVPWGPFQLPDVEGWLLTQQAVRNGMSVLEIQGRVKRKYLDRIHELIAKTREILKTESIYRGKAIKVQFRNTKGEQEVDPPTFMDLSRDYPVIFSKQVEREILINLLTSIRRARRIRETKIQTKRGVLLYGSYGSGKTLTAHMVAKESINAGRTFIYIENSAELPDVLPFAASLEPSTVFAEDIDRITSGLRTQNMDQLLNRMDGINTKNTDIITVLTTNNLNLIHPAFLRECRIDSIIKIDEPDSHAVETLIRTFAGENLDANEDLGSISAKISQDKRSPAFILAVVERSKLEKLAYAADDEGIKITERDIRNSLFDHAKEREEVQAKLLEGDLVREAMKEYMQQVRSAGMKNF